jgi:hypothetical protein
MIRALWVTILFSLGASAGSFTESFDTTARKGSSPTLMWNISLGRLHPSLTVTGWQTFIGTPTSTSLDFGDGRYGVFDGTTMANFDSDPSTPNVIDLDTNTYFPLEVTDFTLPTGVTLRPVGANALIIKSLNDVKILGTAAIDCAGGDGEDTKTPDSLVSSGGKGRCGGQDGGDGGRYDGGAFVAASSGALSSGSGHPLGGAGGADGTYGGGGGGSMYNNTGAGDGYDPTTGAGTTVPGTAGTNFDNQDFTTLLGSAGGGGGGAYHVGGADDSTGAGGGAGGGAVVIYALHDFLNEGLVSVKGGNGGGATGTTLGGLGGGGGGGTVKILAGHDFTDDGQILAAAGAGGARGGGNEGRGGDGGPGRAWYTDNDNSIAGTGTEDTACILVDCGTVGYDIGTEEAVTTVIDLQSTRPALDSFTMNSTASGGSSVTVDVAGSDDGFASDDTGWISTSALPSVSKKRYVKFRVRIDNQDAVSPAFVDDFTLNYSENTQDMFTFGSGCGRVAPPGGPDFLKFLFQIFVFLSPVVFIKLSRLARGSFDGLRSYQLRPKNNLGSQSVSR